jgi:hypothetical protein
MYSQRTSINGLLAKFRQFFGRAVGFGWQSILED